MRPCKFLAALLLTLVASASARAQDTVQPVDLGMLRDEEVAVVQKLLYTMTERTELGVHLGVMPFDPYTTAPMAGFTFGRHFSETLGWELALGGGYGFKNQTYRTLEGPTYGVAPEAYRFLGRGLAAVEWTPIYAKMNWRGQRVVHYNTYFSAGAGATLEQTVLPTGAFAVGPTVGLGVGMRFFRGERTTLRFEFRDDVFVEQRAESNTTAIKQNLLFLVGISRLGEAKP